MTDRVTRRSGLPPYPGGELGLFATAHVWKGYLAKQIAPFLGARVLEVGAGMGGTTAFLAPLSAAAGGEWCCLEPDPALSDAIRRRLASGDLPPRCRVRGGTIADIPCDERFDTILYIDVLEHLADDRQEAATAARLLAAGGHLVVLAPAFPRLYSPFDAAIGHLRRYDRRSITALTPEGLRLVRLRFLDLAGLLASAANRFLLRTAHPSKAQITFWDNVLVRLSRVLDPLTGYHMGRSILAAWRRSPK